MKPYFLMILVLFANRPQAWAGVIDSQHRLGGMRTAIETTMQKIQSDYGVVVDIEVAAGVPQGETEYRWAEKHSQSVDDFSIYLLISLSPPLVVVAPGKSLLETGRFSTARRDQLTNFLAGAIKTGGVEQGLLQAVQFIEQALKLDNFGVLDSGNLRAVSPQAFNQWFGWGAVVLLLTALAANKNLIRTFIIFYRR